MNDRKIMIGAVCFGAAVFLIAAMSVLSGGGRGMKLKLGNMGGKEFENRIVIPVTKDTEVKLSYYSENVNFYRSSSNELIVEEYLRKGRNSATVNHDTSGRRDVITVQGDEESYFGIEMVERIDVYLPEGDISRLEVKTTSGNINSTELELLIEEVTIEARSGEITLMNVKGNADLKATSGNIHTGLIEGNAKISTNSGNIKAEGVEGTAEIEATSGGINLQGLTGATSVRSNSGNIKAEFLRIPEEISMRATSGNVTAVLPEGGEFSFQANTTSGNINTYFDDSLSYNKRGNEVTGVVGENGAPSIFLQANSGNITVKNG